MNGTRSSAASDVDDGVSQLYRTHRLAMVRIAILLVDDLDSAEDVVQDAYVALHRHWDALRDNNAAVAYLRTSVVNSARSLLRRRGTARRSPAEEERPEPAADAQMLVRAEQERVLAAVRTLPPRQQEVLVLRFWSELSEADIADTLGISKGTVKSTASRALDALEEKLGSIR